jgi:esterase/lipase superfamily enzyme
LYASANDDALMLSRVVHGVLRAGGEDANGMLLLAKGIDTVDASHAQTDLLGHGYFDHSVSIISDIHKILATGAPPEMRQLIPAVVRDLKYWIIPESSAGASKESAASLISGTQ